MDKKKDELQLPDEAIMNKIYIIRGQKVMIDRDLAMLYGVETRILNQAVKRNEKRFPSDFMFRMNDEELANWKSQFVISNREKMGLRKPPLVFTEQGVTMLSCVLNSDRAIKVNIQIIRIFTRMREMIMTHKEILLKVERMEKKVLSQDARIKLVFDYLKQFVKTQEKTKKQIGFSYKKVKK